MQGIWRTRGINGRSKLKRVNSRGIAVFAFLMNGCTSCAQLGLCVGNQRLIDTQLIRRAGASDLDWLDQLED